MIKQNQKQLNILAVFLDATCIVLSLLLSWFIRFKSGLMNVEGAYLSLYEYLRPITIVIPLYLILYNLFKLYTPHRIQTIFDEFLDIVKANIVGLFIFTLGLYLFKMVHYSRYLLFLFFITNILINTLQRATIRIVLRKLRRKGYNLKHIIFIGYSESTIEFFNKILNNRHWGYDVVGIIDDKLYEMKQSMKKTTGISEINNIIDETKEQVAVSMDLPQGRKIRSKKQLMNSLNVMGGLKDLEKTLETLDIDEVFITLNIKEYDKLGSIINTCEKCGIRTQIIPDYYKYIPARPYVEEVDGLPIINTRYVPLDNLFNRLIKRIFDIVVSLICLVVFSPIMLMSMLIIKITSPGPVVFKQERVGLNRRKFVMYKFRSMKIQDEKQEKKEWTTQNDPRKTKFGNFIRKTSIDELPQLFNVLKGDMSIIGPRPERPYFVDKFKEEIPKYMVKHQVRPGMTGWAQVNGLRGDTSIKKRIEYDIYYIENWNFKFDIKIMWYTVFRGFVNKNAY